MLFFVNVSPIQVDDDKLKPMFLAWNFNDLQIVVFILINIATSNLERVHLRNYFSRFNWNGDDYDQILTEDL